MGRFMLNSHKKGWGKPNQGQCDANCTCDFFFLIWYLLLASFFITLFELCITWQDKRVNSALHEVVVNLILIGGGKEVIEHKVK